MRVMVAKFKAGGKRIKEVKYLGLIQTKWISQLEEDWWLYFELKKKLNQAIGLLSKTQHLTF